MFGVKSFLINKEAVTVTLCLITFGLLLYKDVFSARTLIPNLEPYPDTLHYINPAQNLLKGYGLTLTREGRSMEVNVPPLYPLLLVPFFIIHNDPRMFYFLNITLAFLSFFIFFKIIRKITENTWIKGLCLILYVSNYFIYWNPTIAMAENLTLALFLTAILLLLSKSTVKATILASIIGIGFYATKYASISQTATFFILYLIKLFSDRNEDRDKYLLKITLFLLLFGIIGFVFLIYEYISIGNNFLGRWLHLFSTSLPIIDSSSVGQKKAVTSSWYSFSYFRENFIVYAKLLVGEPTRYLWNYDSLISRWVGIFGLGGIILGLFSQKDRFISISLLMMLLTLILFMSGFYSVDGRYIYTAIPTLVIGVGLFLSNIVNHFSNKDRAGEFAFNVLLIGILLVYLITNVGRLKYQITLNLRHQETPWYYVSVLELNDYFSKNENAKKPIVISSLPPYYIDFFSNGKYSLLPLSKEQEFMGKWEVVWGANDYSSLTALYTKKIKQGNLVYVDKYGLGNQGVLRRDFGILQNNFNLILVKEGCAQECNLYRVGLKN